MFVLVCFDIVDDKNRRLAVKVIGEYGYRVQKSVFECTGINEQQYLRLKSRLEDIIDSLDDTVRFYYICSGCRRRVEFIGIGDPPKDVSAWVI